MDFLNRVPKDFHSEAEALIASGYFKIGGSSWGNTWSIDLKTEFFLLEQELNELQEEVPWAAIVGADMGLSEEYADQISRISEIQFNLSEISDLREKFYKIFLEEEAQYYE